VQGNLFFVSHCLLVDVKYNILWCALATVDCGQK
jgi:hypothetical protein